MIRKAKKSLKWGGAFAATVGLAGLTLASPAAAVGSGYPPPLLPPSCTAVSAGTLTLAKTSAVTTTVTSVEPFAPGTSVTVVFDGVTIETLIAPPSGLITVVFSAETTPGGPEVSLNGTPFVVAHYGTNVLTESGTDGTLGADGVLSCPVDLVLDPAGSVSSGGGGISSTGNPGSTGTSGGGSGSSQSPSGSGPLAFTGADLEALLLGGIALLLMGIVTVVFARRKSARTRELRS